MQIQASHFAGRAGRSRWSLARAKRSRAAVLALSDYTLNDIGVSRQEVLSKMIPEQKPRRAAA